MASHTTTQKGHLEIICKTDAICASSSGHDHSSIGMHHPFHLHHKPSASSFRLKHKASPTSLKGSTQGGKEEKIEGRKSFLTKRKKKGKCVPLSPATSYYLGAPRCNGNN